MKAFWATFAGVLALDQASKVLVVHAMDLKTRGAIEVLPPYLNLRMAWNRGVNFGLLAGDGDVTRWVLVGLALAISAVVMVWLFRARDDLRVQVSGGPLVGGAIGNVIDRLAYGAVADFLNMSCCWIENPYAFNVADIAIFAGALGLVLFADRRKDPVTGRK